MKPLSASVDGANAGERYEETMMSTGEVVWTYQRHEGHFLTKANVPMFSDYRNPEIRKLEGHYHRAFFVDGETFTSKNKARAHLRRKSRKRKDKEPELSSFDLPTIEERIVPTDVYVVADFSGVDYSFPTLNQAQEKAGNIVNTMIEELEDLLILFKVSTIRIWEELPSLGRLIKNNTYLEMSTARMILVENMRTWNDLRRMINTAYPSKDMLSRANHSVLTVSLDSAAHHGFANALEQKVTEIQNALSCEDENESSVTVPLEMAAGMVNFDELKNQVEKALKVYIKRMKDDPYL